MSNKFDLERFKAGEPALNQDGSEMIFLATAPSGEVVHWNKKIGLPGTLQWHQYDTWTMKPKEEWTFVHKTGLYNTKEDALKDLVEKVSPEFQHEYKAVKIIRE